LHKRMQKALKEEEESNQTPPNESDQNSSTRTDSDSLSFTSSPRSDGWSWSLVISNLRVQENIF